MNTGRRRTLARVIALLAAAGCGATGAAAAPPAAVAQAATPPKAPAATPEAASYDVGLLLGSQLQHNGLAPVMSLDALIRGVTDAVAGRAMTTDEREAAQRFMREAHDSLFAKNRAQGREFLARNAKLPGIVATPSGLQYQVLAAGDPRGKPPAPTDQVSVRFRVGLADGTEIDRSETHDRPATFRVNSVFKAWQEAFAAMKPGAKWRLFVPPELGYGNSTPPTIPPGALLIYDLELVRVDPPEAVPMNRPAAPGRNAPDGAVTPR
jgi:FKBP-type peptidyl-prolyl cis-trans isomerase